MMKRRVGRVIERQVTRDRGRSVLVERLRDEVVGCVGREGEGGQLEM